ncbi:translin-associated factor X-interacting protein 1 isoform X2 [Protopterus annectens]|nr:translin-associated factor X-interacting protein 1 isoform X2 [Protopterus annectens]
MQTVHSAPDHIMHGCEDERARTISKPRFLEQLESYLKKEIQSIDITKPNAQELKLQAYREVFEYFIEDFKTYKPLLSAIKNEYEITLACHREQIRALEPLKTMLVTVSEQCEQKILALRDAERSEINTLKQEKVKLLKCIDKIKEEQIHLQSQVKKLQDELAAEYLRYRNEYDARKVLVSDINELRYQHEEMKQFRLPGDTGEDPVKLKVALKMAREDLAKVQIELNQMKADYGDVVPRRNFEALEKNYNNLIEQHETIQKDYSHVRQEYDTLLEVHKQVQAQRDKFHAELEQLKRSSTPRPDWSRCADVITGGAERWASLAGGLSSNELVDVLLREIADKGVKEEEYINGLGIGNDIPLYLRYDGQIKHMKLSQKDLFNIVKDIWKEKTPTDQQASKHSSMPEFFQSYLQTKYGSLAIDWAYNIYESCQRHESDEFINLFFSILTGKMDESVYHAQISLMSHLFNELTSSDTANNGILSNKEFRDTLKKAFPLKNDSQIQELIKTAESQLGTPQEGINYKTLFAENKEGRAGAFITLLREQQTIEKQDYLNEVRRELGNVRELKVGDLREAFHSTDPSMDKQTLESYLCYAFQTPKESLEHASPRDINTVFQRLLAMDVKRQGPSQMEN